MLPVFIHAHKEHERKQYTYLSGHFHQKSFIKFRWLETHYGNKTTCIIASLHFRAVYISFIGMLAEFL